MSISHLTTLADSTRNRILLLLESGELAVGELAAILQLPQSTISRQLKILGDDGWLAVRSNGTSRYYRMEPAANNGTARRLWAVVREEAVRFPEAARDADQRQRVIAERRARSKHFFSTNAATWDESREVLFGVGVDLTVAMALIDPGSRVADLGCGTGAFAARLAPHVAHIVAVDESPEMLTKARARLAGLANVELHQAPLEQLPRDLPPVDVAIFTLVLHYLAEPWRALQEASRILRPSGRLVIVEMQEHDHDDLRATMGHAWPGFAEDQLRLWLDAAGFQTTQVRRLEPDARAKGPRLLLAASRKP
jgi:ArsR family transcriptional regulator